MGAGASALPARLREGYCKSVMRELYNASTFAELVDSEVDASDDHTISPSTFIDYISSAHDVFLSHDWGKDEKNHKNVVKMATLLRAKGLKVWLDEDHIHNNTIDSMNEGIDRSRMVIVCITSNYQKKVSGHGPKGDKDNCLLEYYRALADKGAKGIIPVVMDPHMLNTEKWYGPLKTLNQELYKNCSSNGNGEETPSAEQLEELAEYALERLESPLRDIISSFRAAPPSTPTRTTPNPTTTPPTTSTSTSSNVKGATTTPPSTSRGSVSGTITTPSTCLTLACPEGIFDERIDVDGNSHLIRACRSGSHKEVKLLIGDGADVNKAGRYHNTGLHWAAKNGHFACVALLLEHGADVSHADHTGCTALMKASMKGYSKIISLLISYKANVDKQNNKGHTALMFACKSGNCEAVKVLINTNGVNVNIVSNRGMTALMAACGDGHVDIVEFLLTVQSIDILLTNSTGVTCYDYARNGNFRDVMTLLRPLFIQADKREVVEVSPHWAEFPRLEQRIPKGSKEFYDAYFQEVIRNLHYEEDKKLTIDVYDTKHHIMIKKTRPPRVPLIWSEEVRSRFNERLESDCQKRRDIPPEESGTCKAFEAGAFRCDCLKCRHLCNLSTIGCTRALEIRDRQEALKSSTKARER